MTDAPLTHTMQAFDLLELALGSPPRHRDQDARFLRWDGATLTVDDTPYSQPDTRTELALDCLEVALGARPTDSALICAFADEVLAPLTGSNGAPFVMSAVSVQAWAGRR